MTKLEQIRHGFDDGQTIFRRQSVGVLLARIAELEAYCDKLAAGLPDGMLPKDVENLREANAIMAQEIYELKQYVSSLNRKLVNIYIAWNGGEQP